MVLPWCFDSSDEKLRAIGIFSAVGHGKYKFFVLQLEVLIIELVPIDAVKRPIIFPISTAQRG